MLGSGEAGATRGVSSRVLKRFRTAQPRLTTPGSVGSLFPRRLRESEPLLCPSAEPPEDDERYAEADRTARRGRPLRRPHPPHRRRHLVGRRPDAGGGRGRRAKANEIGHELEVAIEQYNDARLRLQGVQDRLADALDDKRAAEALAAEAMGQLEERAVAAYTGAGSQMDVLLARRTCPSSPTGWSSWARSPRTTPTSPRLR